MLNILRRVESKHLFMFWVACLIIFGVYSPSVLTNANIYMGMLIGYVQAKTQILLLLGSNIGEKIIGSYLSLRYKFGLSSTSHDGLNILFVNALYFAIIATVLYILTKRFGKYSQLKTVVISAIISGIIIVAVGASVLALNSKVLSQGLSDKPYIQYVVQAGDTCGKIAFDYNVPIESIAKWNNLPASCDSIAIGQSLVIPLSAP